MCIRETECVIGKQNVWSGDRICVREIEFVFGKKECVVGRLNDCSGDRICIGETACGRETECVFGRQSV